MNTPLLVLVLAAAGCSGDDSPVEPHALGGCDKGWTDNGFTQCEAACKSSTIALTASGPSCTGHDSAGPIACSKTFEFQGLVGCCASVKPQVLYAECE